MPRISAPTVREHRERQQRLLLDAARDLVVDGGVSACTLAETGRRCGLARSSVYAYFTSVDDLLVALASDRLPRWEAALDAGLDAARGGGRRGVVRAVVESAVALADDRTVHVLSAVHCHDPARSPLSVPGGTTDRVAEALAAEGVGVGGADPRLVAPVVVAMGFRCAQLVADGAPRQDVLAGLDLLVG